MAALRAAGRSWYHPEVVVVRLGGVLGALWVRLGGPGGRLWSVLGSPWRHLRLSEGVLALRMEAERSISSRMSFADRF